MRFSDTTSSNKSKNENENIELKTFYTFKSITRSLNPSAMLLNPKQKEFKTKLRFDPSKLSTGILKRYLKDILNGMDVDDLLSGNPPEEYMNDPDNLTNYKVLKELGMMSVTEWKKILEVNMDNVEHLYLQDDMMLQDSRYYYESWKIIQEEVGSHEKQMSFFRLISEIVRDLSSRNVVEIISKTHEYDDILKNKDVIVPKVQVLHDIPSAPQGYLVNKDTESIQEKKEDDEKMIETKEIQMEQLANPFHIMSEFTNQINQEEEDDESKVSLSESTSTLPEDDEQWKVDFS